jgi:hypothetical protein
MQDFITGIDLTRCSSLWLVETPTAFQTKSPIGMPLISCQEYSQAKLYLLSSWYINQSTFQL